MLMATHRDVRWTLLVLALMTGTLARPTIAEACSCAPSAVSVQILPADQAQDFPTNGKIHVFVTGGVPSTIKRALLDEFRLRDADGSLVELNGRVELTMLTLTPKSELRPKTRYSVERLYAYSQTGQQLSDDQRVRDARTAYPAPLQEPPPAMRAWFRAGTFETGSGASDRRPTPPSTTSARIEFAYGGGDCGPGEAVVVDYRLNNALGPEDIVGVELKDHGLKSLFPANEATIAEARGLLGGPRYFAYFGNLMCTRDVVEIGRAEQFQARLVVVSATGQVVREEKWTPLTPPEHRASGRSPEPALFGPHGAERLSAEQNEIERYAKRMAERFVSPPIKSAIGVEPLGPRGCVFGLESAGDFELPEGGPPHSASARPQLHLRGPRAFVLYEDEREARIDLVDFDPKSRDARRRTILTRLAGPEVAFGSDALVTATTSFRSDRASTIHVSKFEYDGSTRWTTLLPGEGINWHPHIARLDERILVVWTTSDVEALRHSAHWAVLDALDGSLKATGTTPWASAQVEVEVALSQDEKSFLISWSDFGARGAHRSTVSWARVDKNGKFGPATVLLRESARSLAWAQGQPNALLVETRDAIELFQPQERSDAPPVRKRVVEADGMMGFSVTSGNGLYFLGWRPDESTRLNVVDTLGHVADPVMIAHGARISGLALAPIERGVLAVYRAQGGAQRSRVERFVCREKASQAAPARARTP